jgi:hypothetical protein
MIYRGSGRLLYTVLVVTFVCASALCLPYNLRSRPSCVLVFDPILTGDARTLGYYIARDDADLRNLALDPLARRGLCPSQKACWKPADGRQRLER